MADPKTADLRELERATRKLVDTQKDLRGAVDRTANAMTALSGRTTTSLAGLAALDSQIAGLMKTALPLEEALAGVNGALNATAALAKVGGEALVAFTTTAEGVTRALSDVVKQQDAVDKSQTKSRETVRLSSDEVRKLGGSLKATFASLASGADPFKVFLEQGPAIAGVFADAATSGVGLRGVLLGIAETVAPMLLPLAGVAAAAAAIAAPFAIGAAAINASNKDITAGLGLTADQLANVKDKSVTMGDVATATFQVLSDKLSAAFGPSVKQAGEDFQAFLAGLAEPAAKAVASVIGAFAGAFATIRATWSMLPAAMGDIIYSGANLLIEGVEKMINGVIALANGMITSVNGVAKKLGLSISLPELSDVHIQRLNNRYAGAANAVASIAGQAYKAAFKSAHDETLATFGEISDRTVKVARERIRNSAPKAEGRGGGGGRAASAASKSDWDGAVYREPVSIAEEAVLQAGPAAFKPKEPLTTFIDPISKGLDDLVQKLTNISSLAPELGKQFEAAFGRVGKALGDVLTSFSAYALEVAKIDKAAVSGAATPEQRAQAQIKGYVAMAGAAKGFFRESTDGYKAMQVAEIAFHTIETLNTIKSMALNGAETASAVTGETTKQVAFSATAYAKTLGSVPFPFNLLAGAAVLAALAQVGAAIGGKPGGASVPGANDMQTRQDSQGAGSVLGDGKARSESLEKALTHAQAYESKDLEYGNAMVRSLKSIDDQIGAVAAALARSFGAGGMLSTEGLALGKAGSSPTLSNLGFAKSTTRTLQDQGVQLFAATLGEIANGGLSGATYQQVLETTKKSVFGITTSKKSKVSTESGALDPEFLVQVTELIGALGKGVGEAARAIQASGFEAALAGFKVDLGKLSFKDMTGSQIEEALNAVFGKLGDDMAKAAVPVIAQFQKVGEGAFETLVRVARQYEVIDTTLKSIGMNFGDLGLASLAARERLVDLVGGLDAFTDQATFFAEHFLTEDERLKPVKDSVAAELQRLGQPANLSRDGFKAAVLGQDVSTDAGAKLYAALMALAPAFDKVATAAEAAKAAVADKKASILGQIDDLVLSPAERLAKSRAQEMEAVKALDASLVPLLENLRGLEDAAQAAKLATDRSNMLADLMDAQGRTEEAKQLRRGLALAQIQDPQQRAYQQQIWAAEDAAAKVSAARDVLTQAYQREQGILEQTRDRFEALSKSLRAFSASLSDAGADPATRYRRTRETFLATASLARLGNVEAMERLQAEGEVFTAASRDYAPSSLDYLRDLGLVRSAVDDAADTADRQASIAEQQLKALEASVAGLIQINGSVIGVQQAIASLQGALAAARDAGVGSVGGIPIPGATPSAGVGGLTQAEKDFNNARFNWILTQSGSSSAAEAATTTDPAVRAVYQSASRYTPGYMDIVSTRGIEAANAMVAAGQLTFLQNGGLRFATGGGFEVGGSGPPDSKLFNLALSPGEAVNVTRADKKGDQPLIRELRALRQELADLRSTSARIATSNDKMERTLSNVTEGGRAMQTQAAA